MNESDVIVVGGRCAGSSLAMLLARQGTKVVVLDRATFPSDTISTHVIQAEGVISLQRWGLLDTVLASGLPRLGSIRMLVNGIELSPPTPVGTPVIAPRRTVLDKILVDAARQSGADVREGFSVREVIVEDGVAVGVRGKDADGADVELRAQLVVGADGCNSRVAHAVDAEMYDVREGRTAGYYSYYSGMPAMPRPEIVIGQGRFLFFFPTNDDQVCIGAEVPADMFESMRANPEQEIQASFDRLAPELGDLLRNGRREERMSGMKVAASFYRKPFGPGWALVGDAAYHKDPITGAGITDSFRDAELLATAIGQWLSGAHAFEDAMSRYEDTRNQATKIPYEAAHQLSSLDPNPGFVEMMRKSFESRQAALDGSPAGALA